MQPLDISNALDTAFKAAVSAAITPNANPRVGCVILDIHGQTVGIGAHLGAGSPHAEVAALTVAGDSAVGGTAVVTLEPCNHEGLTGPCVKALIEAGISRVYFALSDPHPHVGNREGSSGGPALRAAGIEVHADVDVDRGRQLLGTWLFRVEHGRPFVTWKVASSADGFIAPADRSTLMMTSAESQAEVHLLRSRVGAILTGTGTVAADDPRLTARDASGAQLGYQPRRVVIGSSDVPSDAAVVGSDGFFTHARTRDVREVLGHLADQGIHHVLLECGPGLAQAFLDADCVDEVIWYTAPIVLGDGIRASATFSAASGVAPSGWHVVDVASRGVDQRLTLAPDGR